MAHKGKWARICERKKGQECFNCANRLNIKETKAGVSVTCDIGYGSRTLDFPRNVTQTPYCGAWKSTNK